MTKSDKVLLIQLIIIAVIMIVVGDLIINHSGETNGKIHLNMENVEVPTEVDTLTNIELNPKEQKED